MPGIKRKNRDAPDLQRRNWSGLVVGMTGLSLAVGQKQNHQTRDSTAKKKEKALLNRLKKFIKYFKKGLTSS